MGGAYTPGLKVTAHAVVRKARRLPLAGTVLVRAGERVTADQVVARTELPGKVHALAVASQLAILPDELPDAMRKRPGDAVARDELLAATRSFFGLFKGEVRAPVDGAVESVSRTTGQVLLREPPIPIEVTAYVDGLVVEELAGEGVVVEAEGAYVQGIFGVGGEVRGPLRLVARAPEETLDAERIGADLAGAIVVAGGRLTLAALRRCVERRVAAVVCGSFAYQDLRELLGRDLGVAITGHETLGLTLIVTEGFGAIAMARATHELLAASAGRAASASGATQIRAGVIRPEIIVPGTLDGGAAAAARAPLGLAPGAAVRCIRAPYFGRLGVVVALPPGLARMPSESLVRVVDVELADGARATLPRANVELVERA
jgi:hypothetical protein